MTRRWKDVHYITHYIPKHSSAYIECARTHRDELGAKIYNAMEQKRTRLVSLIKSIPSHADLGTACEKYFTGSENIICLPSNLSKTLLLSHSNLETEMFVLFVTQEEEERRLQDVQWWGSGNESATLY